MSFLKKIFSKKEYSFSDRLEELGYFKYSPSEEIENLKKRIDENYSQIEILSTPRDEKYRPIDLRYYFCDSEDIHEHNGYKEYIEYIRPTLEKLSIYDEVKKTIPDSSNTNIHIDSVYNLIMYLNQILDSNRINENWYPIYGGNDGRLILLTPKQFEFLVETIKDAKSRPFEIESWRKLVVYSKSERSNSQTQTEKKVVEGSRIDHVKYGQGTVKELNDKGVAVIDFKDGGERKIIMKYAKYKILNGK
jgi:hypothetical protein